MRSTPGRPAGPRSIGAVTATAPVSRAWSAAAARSRSARMSRPRIEENDSGQTRTITRWRSRRPAGVNPPSVAGSTIGIPVRASNVERSASTTRRSMATDRTPGRSMRIRPSASNL